MVNVIHAEHTIPRNERWHPQSSCFHPAAQRHQGLLTEAIHTEPFNFITTPPGQTHFDSFSTAFTSDLVFNVNPTAYTPVIGTVGSHLDVYGGLPFHHSWSGAGNALLAREKSPPSNHNEPTGNNSAQPPCCCHCHKIPALGNQWDGMNTGKSSSENLDAIVTSPSQDRTRDSLDKSTPDTSTLPSSNSKWQHRLFSLSTAPASALSETVKEVQQGFHCGLPNCTDPLKVFSSPGAVLEHIQEDDIHVKPFWCTCNVQFATKAIGTRHVNGEIYGPRFTCSICPRRYKRADQLRNHMKLKHPSVRVTEEHLKRLSKRN